MKNTLVFGASGQLGNCLKEIVNKEGLENFVFLPLEKADILNSEEILTLFNEHKPSYVINCAAYTAVDKAEDEVDLAREINALGAENLAKACATFNTTLIHISTDFVFEGNKSIPLEETEIANPINIYGLTKLEGENVIRAQLENYFILRTSWLYSEYGNNFVKTMLRLGDTHKELRVIADQVGTPTYAIDLAKCILEIINRDSMDYGIYHYSNEGTASWFDFAKAIFDIKGNDIKVTPISTSDYITKAARPAYSVMDKTKIKTKLGMEVPYWRESLEKCLEKLGNFTLELHN